jgi:hypothetical protein
MSRNLKRENCGICEAASHVSIHRSTHMTNERIEVITSVERRRRWSAVEKRRLVAATLVRCNLAGHENASAATPLDPEIVIKARG